MRRLRRYMQAKGTAMSEMVLVVPFLLVVVAYVFYFGRGMVRVQRAQVMDRYEVWRQVSRTPGGPKYTEPTGRDNGPQLNDTFFAGNAISVNDSGDTWQYFPDDAPLELVQQISAFSGDAAMLIATEPAMPTSPPLAPDTARALPLCIFSLTVWSSPVPAAVISIPSPLYALSRVSASCNCLSPRTMA